MPFRRVLHPSDFSALSKVAFRVALAVAQVHGAELVLVHVLRISSPVMGRRARSLRAHEELLAIARRTADRRLALSLAEARLATVRARALLLHGDPHREILRAARTNGVDLIVRGTHGRTGASRLVPGSVAERVARSAPRWPLEAAGA